MDQTTSPFVPVSWGELLDKITILEIKRARIDRPEARRNIEREHDLLRTAGAAVIGRRDIQPLMAALRRVNEALWEIEDAIRIEEAASRFGAAFVRLARSVYLRNDERAAIKRRINAVLGSELVEEKSYAGSQDRAFSVTSRTPPPSMASVVTDAGSQSNASSRSNPMPR